MYTSSYAIVTSLASHMFRVTLNYTRLIRAWRSAVKFSSLAVVTPAEADATTCSNVFHVLESRITIYNYDFSLETVMEYMENRKERLRASGAAGPGRCPSTVGWFIFDLRHWKAVVEREESGIEGLSRTGSQSFLVFTVNAVLLWFPRFSMISYPNNRIGIDE